MSTLKITVTASGLNLAGTFVSYINDVKGTCTTAASPECSFPNLKILYGTYDFDIFEEIKADELILLGSKSIEVL